MRATSQFVLHTLALVLIVFSFAAFSRAQTLADLQREWRATNVMDPPKRFDLLLPKLVTFRKAPGNQSWQLDYMLGSSYCEIPGSADKGKIVLHRLLGTYGLPDDARSKAENIVSSCGQPSQQVEDPPTVVVTVSGQLGAVVHGKAGYEVRPGSQQTTSKLKYSDVSIADLKKRVFPLDKASEAAASAVKLAHEVNPSARPDVRDGFVVTSVEFPGTITAECLTGYKRILQSQFNMQPPEKLITVYTAADPEEVPKYAATLHGVHLPLGTIAYSVFEDLSLVGVAAAGSCGSLAHELVHISIRQNFNDSPAWLEEGLASEVAVATPSGQRFQFGESWRDRALRDHWTLRPSVEQLLASTWKDYAAEDTSQVAKVAALHAMAASFIRYLDAKNALVPIYNTMRDSLSSTEPMLDTEIVKKQMGTSLDKIDADFVKWFGHAPAH